MIIDKIPKILAQILKSYVGLCPFVIMILLFLGMRDTTTTLRINKIELLKPVDETEDRLGFEKPNNKYPF